MMKQILASMGFCLLFMAVSAGDIDKAYKALKAGDYSNAYKYLREVITDEPENVVGSFNLARYFSAKDNKAYNIDSANFYIKRAMAKLPLNPEDKETKKALNYDVRDYTIQTLSKTINFEAYAFAEQQNTLESYQHYIDEFTDKSFLEQAVNFRNQKAYMRAMSLKTAGALNDFIKKYPEASEIKEAKERYEKMVYENTTADQRWESYKKYIDSFPSGKYIPEATNLYNEKLFDFYSKKNDLASYIDFEKHYKNHPKYNAIQDSIYKLATKAGTVEAYTNFVRNYKQNRNVNDGWQQLYLLYTAAGTEDRYRSFLDNYSDCPNKDQVYRDIELSKKELRPVKMTDKYGYAWQPTPDSFVIVIAPEYEEAYEFKNGLAAVRSKPCNDSCNYFYINRANERAIASQFNYAGDFDNGIAVVGFGNCETSDCRYAIIDKRGVLLTSAGYEEINEPTEGVYLAMKDDKYGFIDRTGQTIISHKYTDALPYSMGVAAVAIDGNWFFIDKTGRQLFINRFMDLSSFADSVCAVTQDKETWGYVDFTGNFVIQPQYETAEDFVNGYAIVSKKEKDPKNKSLTISQRYRIDKTGKVVEKLTAPVDPAKKTSKKKGRR